MLSSRGRGLSIVPLLVIVCIASWGDSLAVVVSGVAAPTADKCASLERCSECVFDASDGILSIQLQCAWCATTNLCMHYNHSAVSSSGGNVTVDCPDLRHVIVNPTCPDMSCAAARTTNNIYICRPGAILAVVLASVLVVLNVCFYFWLYAIRQLPWKYEPHVRNYLAGETAVTIENVASIKAEEIVLSVNDNTPQQQQQRLSSCCPVCKMVQPTPLGPGLVCFWCDIARFGFMPLFIGISSAFLSLVLLFFVSLKPWFADGFFAYLLSSAYIVYAAFGAFVYRGRGRWVHVPIARDTLYVELALRLRGRPIHRVIPALAAEEKNTPLVEVNPATAVSRSLTPSPRTQHPSGDGSGVGAFPPCSVLTPEEINRKRAETTQLLSMDYLGQEFRKVLRQTLDGDECVLWWEKPSVSSVISYDLWLVVDLAAAASLGVWMFVASTIKDTNYVLIRLFSTASMDVIGFAFLTVFFCLLITTLSGATRLYILTDRRLLTIYSGVVSPMVAETDLLNVRCASVYGYKMFLLDPVLTFSWEVPLTERKMPPIKSHNFPGVVSLKEFLRYFRAVAPVLPAKVNQSRRSMRHNRQVWRMHLFFSVLLLQFLPVITLYPLLVPGFLSLLLLIILGTITLATVYRGLRVQHVTYASLSLAGNWAIAQSRSSDAHDGSITTTNNNNNSNNNNNNNNNNISSSSNKYKNNDTSSTSSTSSRGSGTRGNGLLSPSGMASLSPTDAPPMGWTGEERRTTTALTPDPTRPCESAEEVEMTRIPRE